MLPAVRHVAFLLLSATWKVSQVDRLAAAACAAGSTKQLMFIRKMQRADSASRKACVSLPQASLGHLPDQLLLQCTVVGCSRQRVRCSQDTLLTCGTTMLCSDLPSELWKVLPALHRIRKEHWNHKKHQLRRCFVP